MANKLVLDTNIWIYLTKENNTPLFEKLKEKIKSNEIELLVNDIIIKEWYRNKENTIKSLLDSTSQEYKCAKNLAKFLSKEEKDNYLNFLNLLNNETTRQEGARHKVEEVEQVLCSSIKIDVTDLQKLFIVNLAIEKKGPFEVNKNNFNDALILRNIIEHCTSANYPSKYDLIYVSNNPRDFCSDKKEQIYPEILDGFKNLRLKTVTELGKALGLSDELIDDFDNWLEQGLQDHFYTEYEISRGK